MKIIHGHITFQKLGHVVFATKLLEGSRVISLSWTGEVKCLAKISQAVSVRIRAQT